MKLWQIHIVIVTLALVESQNSNILHLDSLDSGHRLTENPYSVRVATCTVTLLTLSLS